MNHGGAFAEILQQKLGDFDPEPPAASAHAWRRPAQGPTVLYFDARVYATSAPAHTAPVGHAGPAQVRPFVRPSPPPRPRRVLTALERQALEQFVALGASLTAEFTDGELRSAFRTLARQYHPDRHPGCGPFEQLRLSHTFASVCEAYRHLLSVQTHAVAAA